MEIRPAPSAFRGNRMPILVGLGVVGLVAVILAGAVVVGSADCDPTPAAAAANEDSSRIDT
jgi:hypothetical protein